MAVIFWVLLATIFYIYAGYGLLMLALVALRPKPPPVREAEPQSATLLIAAHNEEKHIARKLQNALELAVGPHQLEIVVVSDGSTDKTVLEAKKITSPRIKVIEIESHVGKAAALNRALMEISSDVVIFTDANSILDANAIINLLRHFGNSDVGGVCGRIGVPRHKRAGLGQGEALYWRYDHALKSAESQLSGAVSAQGALYAVRRRLLGEIPPAVADDLYNSLRVVAQDKRLVFEPEATVEEAVSSSVNLELGRRIRSTERGWRGLMMMSDLLNPMKYGFYSVQLFSHKVLRRLSPFLLIGFFVTSLSLFFSHPVYAFFAVAQVAFYVLAGIGWIISGRGSKLLSLPFFFVLGHTAMAIGLINVLRGKRSEKWKPARSDLLGN